MDYPSQPKYALRCQAAEDRAVLGHPLSKLPPTGAATSDSVTQTLTFSQWQPYVDMLARMDPKSAFLFVESGGGLLADLKTVKKLGCINFPSASH